MNDLNNGRKYVDLGLPSGTLWASCNVGASKPEDCGDYISWHQCEEAASSWGDGWQVPTKEQCEELKSNTTRTWMKKKGVQAMLFKANNGKELLMPAAGFVEVANLYYKGLRGNYWTSSLNETSHDWLFPTKHYPWFFDLRMAGQCYMSSHHRPEVGHSVRLVRLG